MRSHVSRGLLCLGSLALTVILAAGSSGCKSTGQGIGETPGGHLKVDFTWEQSAPTSGTLQATVTSPGSAPERYAGKFYQITRDTQIQTLGGLWDPWYPGWDGWAFWGPAPQDSFVEHYTGHVVANLAGPDGKRMRCQFELNRSGDGMKGGGQGQCQLPSGQTIEANFPPT